jgi:4-hydroxybenzoate polyprenyltransferase
MSAAVKGVRTLRVYLEMIKIEHSVFALPFAMIGMMWGSRLAYGSAWPGWWKFVWIVVAMISCRSAAMSYNRIADRDVDAINPRTKMRAIPAGILELRQANFFFVGSCAIFFLSAWLLNPLALALSPLALGVTLFYSRTKRFTPLCHFVLGLSLGIAPAAAWIGVTGRLALAIVPISVAVLFWTAGFDIIYSLQDEEFDREQRLRSLPETLGKPRALLISRLCHIFAVLSLIGGGILIRAGFYWYAGVAGVSLVLLYEQSIVSPTDLSRVNRAFFELNGFVGLLLFIAALADQLLRA